jgi:hypothetical protein
MIMDDDHGRNNTIMIRRDASKDVATVDDDEDRKRK